MTTGGSDVQPFSWFDTTELEKLHDRIAADCEELGDHLSLIHSAMNMLHLALRLQPHPNDESLVLLRVCARSFNTAGAAMKLARSGFFQPAFAMVRDLVEVEFLTDLFRRDRGHLKRWINLDSKTRKREFQPVKIRIILDDLDGFTTQRRANEYELLSKYASHIDPDGFQIISPGNQTQIGPFPSRELPAAFLQELAKHLTMVSIHLATLLQPLQEAVKVKRQEFDSRPHIWRKKYIPSRDAQSA
jgi:hypothetical protein